MAVLRSLKMPTRRVEVSWLNDWNSREARFRIGRMLRLHRLFS